ncbi:MAG: hypothetical protein K9L17_14325 [Clostridiales bacterium]|nr:hypothetical protein [Clostridiales bacterium]MCF8023846.1 hypothetical protein [Clostridiales bacterium]
MDNFDKYIKQSLQEEVYDVQFSSEKKAKLQQAMYGELKKRREKWWARAVRKFKTFWSSTYEIDLKPVAAAAAVLFIFTGAVAFKSQLNVNAPRAKNVYMQQVVTGPGDNTKIIYIPVKEGEI